MVRGRGAIAMSELRLGDLVWAAIPDGDGFQLRFDRLVAFLHRAPEMEAEVLQISHEQGHRVNHSIQLFYIYLY